MLYETCFVLRRRAYSETSLLLEVLTRESQYVHALYKGAKRKGGTPIDLFSEYEMSWRPRVGLVTVRSCELKRVFTPKGDAIYAGLYVNELVRRGMRENQVVDGIQHAYQATVQSLSSESTDLDSVLRTFEKRYLKALGFEVEFDREQASGREIENASSYRFEPTIGFTKASSPDRNTYAGHVLLDIARERFEQRETKKAAKLILRDALSTHLGDRALKAPSLLSAKQLRDAETKAHAHD